MVDNDSNWHSFVDANKEISYFNLGFIENEDTKERNVNLCSYNTNGNNTVYNNKFYQIE